MAILVYGMNHASAPIEVRERAAFAPGALSGAVARLSRTEHVSEGLILSTCNRTEVLVSAGGRQAATALRRFLAGERRMTEDELDRHCYLHADREAVRHVFRVASSLDSMVIGEAQILGQVKEAYAAARQAGALGTVLDNLMKRAFSVAKRVRTDTAIARYPVSIAHAAAGLARDIFGDLRDNAILILGAGKMARLAAQPLMAHGVRSVAVVNRSFQGAADLARELGGRAAPFDRLFEEMERADIVIASTAAPHYVVRHEDALRLSRARRGRPLFFIDIALPRDIDPRVNEIGNVYIYDIDDLQGVVRRNLDERRHEAALAEAIVDRETASYLSWLRTLEITPLIVDLRRHLHQMGRYELHRFRNRLGSLTPEQREVLEDLTAALINKVLHHPIRALKHCAASGEDAGRVEFLRRAFGLDGPGPRAERPRPGGPAPEAPARRDLGPR
ncbi:MAG: glutamyl-tRNA reductase [Acidobacteriota bacterium]